MIIGLTGGIATGKSTVAQMFVARGAKLVDADRVAREVVLPGSPVLEQVVNRFGQAILQADGTLHRKKLGEIIFADKQAKQDLEAILHPAIRLIIRERMDKLSSEDPDGCVIVDIPLLYESGLETMFEQVLLVYTPREIQLERLMQRDRLTMAEAELRLQAQMPIEEKRQRAQLIIDNSGTQAETEAQVEQLWNRKEMG